MLRQARLDAPGVLHLVMIRGIERRKIFISDRDWEDFLERLSKLLPVTETACYAWVFLSNHAYFLFRTGVAPLSSLMFCIWAVRELGLSLRELARRLELSAPAVGYSVERGEFIARDNGYHLMDE